MKTATKGKKEDFVKDMKLLSKWGTGIGLEEYRVKSKRRGR